MDWTGGLRFIRPRAGDGDGSRRLAAALRAPEGDRASPIDPAAPWPFGVVHYRRNPPGARPPFELWVHDRRGPTIREPRP